MSHILIVHAHPEPESFSSSLARAYRDRLLHQGHTVDFKDLYALDFDPISDRRNFRQAFDSDYFKQQQEELHASASAGFSLDLEEHIRALERADALIFSFPLWWFSMPAVLKGWVDRVFAYGRIYGGAKLYEGGVGQARKPARILMTTGGPREHYSGWGINPSMESILSAIEHGIFWFNGFLPLPATIAWGPARWTQPERIAFLEKASEQAAGLFRESPRLLPRMGEFQDSLHDRSVRTRVELRLHYPAAHQLDEEWSYLHQLQRRGKLLDLKISSQPEWIAYLDLRVADLEEVQSILTGLPRADLYRFSLHPLDPLFLNNYETELLRG